MPASSPSSAGTGPSVILVEEYGALAVAIGSALKKFAPGHSTRVAPNLAAAETLAAELRPELLIIDVDPLQAGIVDFFARMRFALPDARVLIIAAGTSRDLLAARQGPVAFEFVEKPFDLAELGRAVEALLTPRGGASGTLRSLGVVDMLPLLCASAATMVLSVEAAGGRLGEIDLAQGQIVHAVVGAQVGADALVEMLSWPAPRLSEADREFEKSPTIRRRWQPLLIEAFSRPKKELRPRAKTQKQPGAAGIDGEAKKVVVIDDTELLLIFVEDILATAAPDINIVTAANGAEGLQRIAASKPDVVLLDFSLPDFTGDEVCRRLLEEESTADIPIIMMSGHVPEMEATAARYRNVVATIAKPFLSGALLGLVQTTLATTRAKKEKPVPLQSSPPAPSKAPSEAVLAKTAKASSPAVRERNGRHKNAAATAVLPSPLSQAGPVEQPKLTASQTSAAPVEVRHRPQQTTAAAKPPGSLVDAPAPEAFPPASPLPERAAPKSALAQAVKVPRLAPDSHAVPSALVPNAALPTTQPQPRSNTPAVLAAQPILLDNIASRLAPLAIPAANSNAVILGIPLEVLAMQFSPTLRMASIRARPLSTTVWLHLQGSASLGVALPQAGFELGRVDLNTRGHIDTLRLIPARSAVAKPPLRGQLRVSDVAILSLTGGKAMQLTPTTASPMTMELFESFEVIAVELSVTFGVGAVVLRSRSADIRVSLQPGSPSTGATFKSAQVLLDREARISEILLDAIA
ncbi:MAG: response regulator [Chthoniobacterales bacterium]|nr:response regulator [Chthoniobacterales bacterium]